VPLVVVLLVLLVVLVVALVLVVLVVSVVVVPPPVPPVSPPHATAPIATVMGPRREKNVRVGERDMITSSVGPSRRIHREAHHRNSRDHELQPIVPPIRSIVRAPATLC
jgi:hypothetical protein